MNRQLPLVRHDRNIQVLNNTHFSTLIRYNIVTRHLLHQVPLLRRHHFNEHTRNGVNRYRTQVFRTLLRSIGRTLHRNLGLNTLGVDLIMSMVRTNLIITNIKTRVSNRQRQLIIIQSFSQLHRHLTMTVIIIFLFMKRQSIRRLHTVFARRPRHPVRLTRKGTLVAGVLLRRLTHHTRLHTR